MSFSCSSAVATAPYRTLRIAFLNSSKLVYLEESDSIAFTECVPHIFTASDQIDSCNTNMLDLPSGSQCPDPHVKGHSPDQETRA